MDRFVFRPVQLPLAVHDEVDRSPLANRAEHFKLGRKQRPMHGIGLPLCPQKDFACRRHWLFQTNHYDLPLRRSRLRLFGG